MGLINYIKETRGEMKHVNWPTKAQALNYTILVVVITLVTAVVLAAADYIFGIGLEKLILG